MNIAICEDELIYATGMQIAIQTWVQSRNYTDIQIFLYSSAEDLWDDWERGKVFDALFLDIEFQYMSGFELAQRIRCADPNIPIIFVTNSNRYLIQGYEVSAYVRRRSAPVLITVISLRRLCFTMASQSCGKGSPFGCLIAMYFT